MTQHAQHIQAYLFIKGEAVKKTDLDKLIGLSPESREQALTELQETLVGQGLALITTDTHVELTTSLSVSSFVETYLKQEETLSRAASEALALLAYRGPLARYELEVLRGVDCRAMLRQLMRRGLVHQITDQQIPLYDITPQFLEHLGITDKTQLPEFKELSKTERVEELLKEANKP